MNIHRAFLRTGLMETHVLYIHAYMTVPDPRVRSIRGEYCSFCLNTLWVILLRVDISKSELLINSSTGNKRYAGGTPLHRRLWPIDTRSEI